MTTEQRTNLKFLVRLGKSPLEALCMLQQVYQEETLSRSTIFLWHKRFKEGREDVEDNLRGGKPSTSINETFFDVRGMIQYEFLPQGRLSISMFTKKSSNVCFITIMRSQTLH